MYVAGKVQPEEAVSVSSGQPMNLRQAAELLGVAPSTVLARILAGELDAEKDGRRWVIYPEAIERYREARRYCVRRKNGARTIARHPDAAPLTEQERRTLEKLGINL